CSMSLPVKLLLPTPPAPVIAMTRAGREGAGSSGSCSPRAARETRRARATRFFWTKLSTRASCMPRPRVLAQVGDDLVERGARAEDAGHPHLMQFGNVHLGDDAAHQHADMLQAGLTQ